VATDVTLVQYYKEQSDIGCRCHVSALFRFCQARDAGERLTRFEEKAGQARDIGPLAGQVSEKMSASGWQTAPPQDIDLEVVMVTKSACPQQLLEGSLGVIDLERPAFSISGSHLRTELFTPLHDHLGRRVFESAHLLHPVRTTGKPPLAVC